MWSCKHSWYGFSQSLGWRGLCMRRILKRSLICIKFPSLSGSSGLLFLHLILCTRPPAHSEGVKAPHSWNTPVFTVFPTLHCSWHWSCDLDPPALFPPVHPTARPATPLLWTLPQLPQQSVIPSAGYTWKKFLIVSNSKGERPVLCSVLLLLHTTF